MAIADKHDTQRASEFFFVEAITPYIHSTSRIEDIFGVFPVALSVGGGSFMGIEKWSSLE